MVAATAAAIGGGYGGGYGGYPGGYGGFSGGYGMPPGGGYGGGGFYPGQGAAGMGYSSMAARSGVGATAQTGQGTIAATTGTPQGGAVTGGSAFGGLAGSYLGGGYGMGLAIPEGMPRVVPNPMDNTLLIQATPQEYEKILKLLRDLDVAPRQVLIEAKIYEVYPDRRLPGRRDRLLAADGMQRSGRRPVAGEPFHADAPDRQRRAAWC